MSQLCRVEVLTKTGTWSVLHSGVGLLNPARYAEKLAERAYVTRVSTLDDKLQIAESFYGGGGEML